MPHTIGRTRLIASALLGASLVFAALAHAGPAENISPTDPALRQATPAEIQILQFDQNRRNYQQQQQNLRDQDRAPGRRAAAAAGRTDHPAAPPGPDIRQPLHAVNQPGGIVSKALSPGSMLSHSNPRTR